MGQLSDEIVFLCASCLYLIALTGSVCAQFQQPTYYLTASSCVPGTAIGTVYANGATGYSISSSNGQFAVSTNGVITSQTTLISGTYTIYVTSYGNVAATVAAQIAVNCPANVNNGVAIGSFSQSFSFTVTSCNPGTTIGSVYASGASGYSLVSSTVPTLRTVPQFTISSSGTITATGKLTNGVYPLQVTAFGSSSATAAMVKITVRCSSNNSNNSSNNKGNCNSNPPFPQHDDHERFRACLIWCLSRTTDDTHECEHRCARRTF